jgi:uncharacterized membrane protein YeaQ/YmgE (transglycosylase-associated protein family)
MGILAWVVLGAIAGFIANLVLGGREGVIGTIILGIVGALVGGFVAASVLHIGTVNGLNVESIVIAAVGAAAVLAAWHVLTPRRRAFHF